MDSRDKTGERTKEKNARWLTAWPRQGATSRLPEVTATPVPFTCVTRTKNGKRSVIRESVFPGGGKKRRSLSLGRHKNIVCRPLHVSGFVEAARNRRRSINDEHCTPLAERACGTRVSSHAARRTTRSTTGIPGSFLRVVPKRSRA